MTEPLAVFTFIFSFCLFYILFYIVNALLARIVELENKMEEISPTPTITPEQ